MFLTTLTNVGEPFVDGKGNPIVGAAIFFTLVDSLGMPIAAWDSVSKERVSTGPVSVVTDANGEFSIDLWPTDRSTTTCYWMCTTAVEEVPNIVAPLPSSLSDVLWSSFAAVPTFQVSSPFLEVDAPVDASLGDVVYTLPPAGTVLLSKIDDTGNLVTPNDDRGYTIRCVPLSVPGEFVKLRLRGNVWWRIG